MIEYRQFRNSDPPHNLRLWHECGLGRGAALGISCNEFDEIIFAQPYFDPGGVIVACRDGELVGFIHAGFSVNEPQTWLAKDEGVIGAVMVHPHSRRQGIGRELVHQAENYLHRWGSQKIFAGSSNRRDPFYCGLYGGSQSAGFLESDRAAAPFFARLGYVSHERHLVFQRSLSNGVADPVGIRIVTVRRGTRLSTLGREPTSWWWETRYGRLDALHFSLISKAGGNPLAKVSVIDLDRYRNSWKARAVGLLDLYVAEANRNKGYGQTLLVEVCRRVRGDMVQLAEAHAAAEDLGAIAVLESSGFHEIDAGVVYRAPCNPT